MLTTPTLPTTHLIPQSLFFLRGPSLPGTLDNITHWVQDQFQDYAKKTVLPQVGAHTLSTVQNTKLG